MKRSNEENDTNESKVRAPLSEQSTAAVGQIIEPNRKCNFHIFLRKVNFFCRIQCCFENLFLDARDNKLGFCSFPPIRMQV